jgi:uncharacterized repeat protein (TIGR01451 family)
VETCDLTNCTYTPQQGEQALTVVKDGNGVCLPDGTEEFTYTITVTNIGDVESEYTNIEDQLDANITADMVSNISNGGVLNGTTITWPGGTLAVGQSLTLTYQVRVSVSQISQFGGELENTVIVDYDPSDPKQTSFSNRETLSCSITDLPQTDLDDYTMFIIAFTLIAMSAVIYRLKFGNDQLELVVSRGSKTVSDLYGKIADKSFLNNKRGSRKFEKEVLQKDKKN